jgi:hypothetical protein
MYKIIYRGIERMKLRQSEKEIEDKRKKKKKTARNIKG